MSTWYYIHDIRIMLVVRRIHFIVTIPTVRIWICKFEFLLCARAKNAPVQRRTKPTRTYYLLRVSYRVHLASQQVRFDDSRGDKINIVTLLLRVGIWKCIPTKRFRLVDVSVHKRWLKVLFGTHRKRLIFRKSRLYRTCWILLPLLLLPRVPNSKSGLIIITMVDGQFPFSMSDAIHAYCTRGEACNANIIWWYYAYFIVVPGTNNCGLNDYYYYHSSYALLHKICALLHTLNVDHFNVYRRRSLPRNK